MPDVLELFELYRNDVYRLAISFTQSKADAEDICQTVFLKLMEHNDITPGKEKAWLMQVTANQSRSLLRSAWWKKTEGLEDVFQTRDNTDDFANMIIKLKPKYRVVVYLYYYEEYSTDEIAKLLHISRSAVTTRLARARKILKQEFEEVYDVTG